MAKRTDWKRAQASVTALGAALVTLGILLSVLAHETWLRAIGIGVLLFAALVLGAGIGIGLKSSRARAAENASAD